MPTPLRILILEDKPEDADLLVLELRHSGFEPDWCRVETWEGYLAHLDPDLDLIFADYSLPQFDGLTALRLLLMSGLDVPFILISGTIGEELAITTIQQGAADYLMKDRLIRLGLAVTQALAEKRLRDEKCHAEKALRSSQALLANILTTASEAIITADKDQRVLFFNRAAEEIFGYAANEVVGQSLDLLLPCQFTQRHHQHIESFLASPETARRLSHRYTVRGRRKDGTEFPADVGISKSIQDGGMILTAILEDVTERDRAERELKLFRTLIDRSNDVIYMIDPVTLRILDVNEKACLDLGYTREELLSLGVPDIDPTVVRSKPGGLEEQLRKSGVAIMESVHCRKDGTTFPVEVNVKLVQLEREYAVAIVRDITRNKQMEEELERRALQFTALHETSRDLMLNRDLPELLQMIAGRAAAILQAAGSGIYLYDEEKGDLHVQAVGGVHNPPLGARVPLGEGMAGRVAETRRFMIVDDYRVWDHRFSQYAGLPITAVVEVPMLYGGELVGVLVVNEFEPAVRKFTKADAQLLQLFADQAASVVHDARMFQQVRWGRERLQSLSRQLMQAQEAERRHIARELHDEIGQILTTVKTNLQALQLSSDVPASNADLAESMLTIDRALSQVRNLSLDLRPSILDDFGLVPALQWYLGRQGRQAGFSGELIADPSAPRLPPDLETICFRVVQEALTNIIRYARARRVIVKLESQDQDLLLEISDDGVGFDVEAARKRGLEGNNIGLLGMQERVLLVGGQFKIESWPSHGTRIIARFPRSLQMLLERRQTKRRSS